MKYDVNINIKKISQNEFEKYLNKDINSVLWSIIG